MSSGKVTIHDAAIRITFSDWLANPYPKTFLSSGNPCITQLDINRHDSELTKRGQIYEFQVPINFNNVIEINVGAVNGTMTLTK